MLKKTVVYFDRNAARRLALELAFKNIESIQFYAYEDFIKESFRLEDLNPTLIITDEIYALKASCDCWVLGREIVLPFHPLELKNKILEKIQNV